MIAEINTTCDGKRVLQDVIQDVIIATLQRHGGHRERTARALGIGVRTLGLKINKWKQQMTAIDSAKLVNSRRQ